MDKNFKNIFEWLQQNKIAAEPYQTPSEASEYEGMSAAERAKIPYENWENKANLKKMPSFSHNYSLKNAPPGFWDEYNKLLDKKILNEMSKNEASKYSLDKKELPFDELKARYFPEAEGNRIIRSARILDDAAANLPEKPINEPKPVEPLPEDLSLKSPKMSMPGLSILTTLAPLLMSGRTGDNTKDAMNAYRDLQNQKKFQDLQKILKSKKE